MSVNIHYYYYYYIIKVVLYPRGLKCLSIKTLHLLNVSGLVGTEASEAQESTVWDVPGHVGRMTGTTVRQEGVGVGRLGKKVRVEVAVSETDDNVLSVLSINDSSVNLMVGWTELM